LATPLSIYSVHTQYVTFPLICCTTLKGHSGIAISMNTQDININIP